MVLYRNTFVEETTELGKYLDTYFLEEVLNEGTINVNREIKKVLSKKEITESDIKKVTKMLNEEDNKGAVSSMVGYVIGIVVAAICVIITYSSPINMGTVLTGLGVAWAGSICSMISMSKDPYKQYMRIMKLEAKARKNLNRAKAAEDEDKIKDIEKVIEFMEALKKQYKTNLANKAKGIKESVLDESEIVTEMKGNQITNDIFKQVLDDLEDLCAMNMDKIKMYDEAIEKMLSTVEGINKDNAGQKMVDVRNIGRSVNEERSKIKGHYGPLSFSLLKTQVTKFNNKYSYVTMSDKKKLASKLISYKSLLKKYGKKYDSKEFTTKYLKFIDSFEASDPSLRSTAIDFIDSWVNAIISEINATLGDIEAILTELDIKNTEKSLKFKVLNFAELRKEKKAKENK